MGAKDATLSCIEQRAPIAAVIIVRMAINEPVAELPSTATFNRAPTAVLDGDFETHWVAWVARGQVHDRRVRRRFVVSAAVIATGGAIVFAFLA
jgi:hypothetical protein